MKYECWRIDENETEESARVVVAQDYEGAVEAASRISMDGVFEEGVEMVWRVQEKGYKNWRDFKSRSYIAHLFDTDEIK